MDDQAKELQIAAEPEGLNVGPVVFQAASKVLIPIIVAVVLIFPIVNLNVQRAEMEATTLLGQQVRANSDAAAALKLNQYDVLDRDAGIYQIPVDRAIEIMVARGQDDPGRVVSPIVPR